MSARLLVERAGPAMTVQDLGRPGLTAQGVSAGGAADRRALIEAAALLGLTDIIPAIEMAGAGGVFSADLPIRFALTGAPMRAHIDDHQIAWNTAHVLCPGQRLVIGGARSGVYGYLTPAGGVDAGIWEGSASCHLMAGIGSMLASGTGLTLRPDLSPDAPVMTAAVEDRFDGGTVRVMPGPQTALFDEPTRARFFSARFRRGPLANRQGVQMLHAEAPFGAGTAQDLASDFVTAGDVQMTGEGQPFVLLSEYQTMGGYPRIGTVVPCDLPIIAQAPMEAQIRFVPVSLAEADALYHPLDEQLRDLRLRIRPLIRDPHSIRDLMRHQLISGVTCGDDLEAAR